MANGSLFTPARCSPIAHPFACQAGVAPAPWDNGECPFGDPTLADAILDRLVHNAYRLNLKGEWMRKRARSLTDTGSIRL